MNNVFKEESEIQGLTGVKRYCLETDRLSLLPLQAHSLALSLVDYGKMQAELGLKVNRKFLDDEEMKYAMKVRLTKVLENSEQYV